MRIFLIVLVAGHLVSGGNFPNVDWHRYSTYNEIRQFLSDIVKFNPTFCTKVFLGTSVDGHNLEGVKIGNKVDNVSKPIVWIDGGNHAREWPAVHLTMYYINTIVKGYGVDPEITAWVDDMNIYAFPLLNPDGFLYTKTTKEAIIRQWRKNMAKDDCTGRSFYSKVPVCCNGVDLNRNFDIGFNPMHPTFNNSCSDEFQGRVPFSEPETRAIRDFVLSKQIKTNLKGLISFHTHGQFIVVPYNHKFKEYPPDYKEMMELGGKMKDAIAKVRGTDYQLGTAADLFKMTASGGAIDWIKKNTGIKYIYLLELPPSWGSSWFAFQMGEKHLVYTADETWFGVKVLIKRVHDEYVLGLKF
uniref:Peptidase_M14 domain-containing protein n=1 Tax=Rhabditophanes sp. KR3021 TaxID=114890 RepID=A0AC35UF95_9BILA